MAEAAQPTRTHLLEALKGISESSFPLDGELIYGPVYTDSYVEIFPGPNYYHNYTSYIDNGNPSI